MLGLISEHGLLPDLLLDLELLLAGAEWRLELELALEGQYRLGDLRSKARVCLEAVLESVGVDDVDLLSRHGYQVAQLGDALKFLGECGQVRHSEGAQRVVVDRRLDVSDLCRHLATEHRFAVSECMLHEELADPIALSDVVSDLFSVLLIELRLCLLVSELSFPDTTIRGCEQTTKSVVVTDVPGLAQPDQRLLARLLDGVLLGRNDFRHHASRFSEHVHQNPLALSIIRRDCSDVKRDDYRRRSCRRKFIK